MGTPRRAPRLGFGVCQEYSIFLVFPCDILGIPLAFEDVLAEGLGPTP